MRDLLSTARRVRTGELGTTRVVTDYSYTNDRLWSPGGVLVGDAALFIDPLFSSGVHFATYSALLAARAINTVLRKAASESDAFDEFERRYRREFRHFYEFLVAFYELHGNEGSEFWSQRKILKPSSRRLRRDFVRRVSGLAAFTDEPATTSHVLRSFEEHTLQLRAASGVDSDALDESRLDQRTMASWQRRLETRLDARLDVWRLGNVKAARRGARAGELVPTPDGLSWRRKRG